MQKSTKVRSSLFAFLSASCLLVLAFSANAQTVDRDRDDDGVANVYDGCPRTPEDYDGFADGDGCPDVDNDGDDIADATDNCPLSAEDSWDATPEGCPTATPTLVEYDAYRDSDYDGLADAYDSCPRTREDIDGYNDGDGCPESPDYAQVERVYVTEGELSSGQDVYVTQDGRLYLGDGAQVYVSDGDRVYLGDGRQVFVAGLEDLCPHAREDYNGFQDHDGCPDSHLLAEATVVVPMACEDVDINDTVHFGTGSSALDASDRATLYRVAELLNENPQVREVRIEGHADGEEGGSEAVRYDLAQSRALAIRNFLIEVGVDSSRLDSQGYGDGQPVASNAYADGRASNRRAAFRVLEPGC